VCAAYTSTADSKFLETLESWFHVQPEILVLFRYPYAAGTKEFVFFSSFQNLKEGIRPLPTRTSVVAFRKPQLPLRGIVDDQFIARCLSNIPEGSEFLITETVRRVYGKMSWFHNSGGVSHAELQEELADCRGTSVAVGLYPPWLDDSDDVVSAIVPDEDGVVRPGAY